MTSMEDLIATISGGMHVSQDGYDLKALQEYLARTIVLPDLPMSPSTSFHPLPPSRSTSSTRNPLSLPPSYLPDQSTQLYPSPISNMSFRSSDNVMMATPVQRPGSLRRSSSYGFGTQPTPGSPSGFEGDAFAPLYQQTYTQPSDPWSRTHPSADVKHYPWAAVGAQQDSFAFRPAQQFGGADERNQQIGPRAPPTPPEEDEEMVEDTGDCGMYEEDKEGKAEGGMEWDSNRNERAEDKHVGGDWQRGRRKQQ